VFFVLMIMLDPKTCLLSCFSHKPIIKLMHFNRCIVFSNARLIFNYVILRIINHKPKSDKGSITMDLPINSGEHSVSSA
jgi:hypothetical protein